MKVIMLLAGRGTRLRPYTNSRPKCLVEVAGQTLLDRQITNLTQEKIQDIVFVTGYCSDAFKNYDFEKYQNNEYATTNMVYSLFQARNVLDDSTEVIIAYGDILYEQSVLQKLLESEESISIVADKEWLSYWEQRMVDVSKDAESFKTNENGRIVEIGQPIKSLSEVEAQYIGLMKFKDDGVEVLKYELDKIDFSLKENKTLYFTDFLQSLIEKGHILTPVYINRGWYEVDTISDLKLCEKKIKGSVQ